MTSEQAQAEINRLVKKMGLHPIVFRVNNRLTRTAGLARTRDGIIDMPQWALDQDSALNTVRHEVAHFLNVQRYGSTKWGSSHGAGWKLAAVDCGAIPSAFGEDIIGPDPVYRYKMTCAVGTCTWKFQRRPRVDYHKRVCIRHKEPVKITPLTGVA